jgi:hypothetical protein
MILIVADWKYECCGRGNSFFFQPGAFLKRIFLTKEIALFSKEYLNISPPLLFFLLTSEKKF